eukprot:COSAG05_NODE_12596_length_462_cov_0.707989_2_plen_67_part_01
MSRLLDLQGSHQGHGATTIAPATVRGRASGGNSGRFYFEAAVQSRRALIGICSEKFGKRKMSRSKWA